MKKKGPLLMAAQHEQRVSMEEYLRLSDRHDLRLEYIDGKISTRDGVPVILLGGVAPERVPGSALVMISDATKEEIEQLAAFVASLRLQPNKENTP